MNSDRNKKARILCGSTDLGSSAFCADLLWCSAFKVPDPVTLVEIDDTRILLTSSLEVARAQKEAKVDEVVLIEEYAQRAREEGVNPLIIFLRERGVGSVMVPGSLGYDLGGKLSKHFSVNVCIEQFYPERTIKKEFEIAEIAKAQVAVDHALDEVRTILSDAHINGDYIFHRTFGDTPITSEHIRDGIEHALYKEGYLALDTIVACGVQAADPHMRGDGPLYARQPIVLDIFPRSRSSLYFTDCTRTFFKGEPSGEMIALYENVREAQEGALEKIRAGVDGFDVYTWVRENFDKKGYSTNTQAHPVHGFIHGLGHGVGLEIHEAPRLGACHAILQEGMVVTVEPGLYYPQAQGSIPAGGVRIEDTVVVTKEGNKNLSSFSKDLRSIIMQ
ncbi:aminopeptidase P family protein [Candidatus Uhrbacteria bacterium]|nr:aminopeptidase P family protein [Candidatus Uhrbacteria bacterium]